MKIKQNHIELSFKDRHVYISSYDKQWKLDENAYSKVVLMDGTCQYFHDFKHINCEVFDGGAFCGLTVLYEDDHLAFKAIYQMDTLTDELSIILETINESNIKEIYFPDSFALDDYGYDCICYRQGLKILHQDHLSLKLPFNGQFCSAAAYMPIVETFHENKACLMISETPEDTRYQVEQGLISFIHLTSLSKMSYSRKLRYVFFDGQKDYNDLCHYYRNYLEEHNQIRTLKEKMTQLPQIEDLTKSALVHTGIETRVQEDSLFYDKENPTKNNHLTTFAQRKNELMEFKKMGMDHLYLHLDGWGVAYDNEHPEPFPINIKAGGSQKMKELVDTCHQLGYLFGIHDQYRDYYYKAKHHDKKFGIMMQDGSYYTHNRWAGGYQNYLCASFAKYFVKKNFTQLKQEGILLDGAYLDVFTCNELDECFDTSHLMTRKDCMNYRLDCFNYLVSQHIMPSSEEVNGWAMPSLVFCHYAPYEFMMHEKGEFVGVGVPLFNLVYHDCLVIPWMMENAHEDYMLYALINGGIPYFKRDAAYPNIDGAFEEGIVPLDKQVDRCKAVLDFYDKIKYAKMMSHQFVLGDSKKQKVIFDNGWQVEINLNDGTYQISQI